MSAAPALPALNGFLTPPTDEETLAMFTPTHPQEIEVETHIGSHWFTQQMRSQPGFTELRPHMKIPEPFRINNFTAGTLRGPGRVPVPPIAFVEDGGKSIVSITYLGEGLCGHPGIVHGGFLATMLDEGMARCSFGVLPHGVGMTASLNINYRAPAMTGSYVVLRAETTKVEGRKAEVMGRIETLPENEGDTPVVLAEATDLNLSIFIIRADLVDASELSALRLPFGMSSGAPGSSGPSASSSSTSESQSAYNDLRRLIPALALELDHLRAALREHNLWLQRYGHAARSEADPYAPPVAPETSGGNDPELPAYSASDVPPYTGGPNSVSASTSTREEVQQRRDQLTEWLGEGEDTLREYSARFAQLVEELGMPPEDVLGTWNEANPDNALPDYERIETNEELMVGGVGEVPPPYVRGQAMEKGHRG
ncbi:putative Thioesterase domain-containing protein [Seiridium cardinale]|uniref:Thioesterase domain-containing protein n=1 Tax=Seiridium cardinale TaxID=138064 RepID=A0ABR2XMF9_9PEZI